MNRAKLFVDNILIYGLGGMLAKLVPFLMLPIVTRLLPNSSYLGLSDMSSTIVAFAQAVAVMGMYDASFRMFFEKDDRVFQQRVCSTALFFVIGSSIIIALGLVVLKDSVSRLFFGSSEYAVLIYISALNLLMGSNASIAQIPTRAQNKRLTFIAMNLMAAVSSYAIAIPLMYMGSYLVALPIASCIAAALSFFVFIGLNRKWFSFRRFERSLLLEMLKIGMPLMPSFLAYWVFSSADRLMIINLIGAGAAGVYVIACKMGHISQLIYTAFAQGWQFFAFSTMKDSDQVELNSKIYEYLGVVSLVSTSLITLALPFLYDLMFPREYEGGVLCVPYLFLSPLLLMLYQVGANQLLVSKKTWPTVFILMVGVLVNLLANVAFIPLLGIEGAALGTLLGYVAINIVAYCVVERMALLKVKMRFLVTLFVSAGYFLTWRFWGCHELTVMLLSLALYIGTILFMYRRDAMTIIGAIGRRKERADSLT